MSLVHQQDAGRSSSYQGCCSLKRMPGDTKISVFGMYVQYACILDCMAHD